MNSASVSAESLHQDYGRPLSIEERSNRYVVHPLSEMIAYAAIRIGVTANQLSVMGLLLGLIAAGFYYFQPDRLSIACGFAAMVLWHVFDGADGRVARETGTSSAFGRVIDGICDHLVFAAVYVALTLSATGAGAPKTVWFLAVAAGASHALQAAAYEERRQRYQRRSRGVARDAANASLLSVNGKRSWFASGYDCIQRFAAGGGSDLDRTLNELRENNAKQDVIQSVVNRTAFLVRQWSILNANNRTIMIAVMALAGFPIGYFIYEIVVLNAVLVGLLIHEARVEATIVRDVAPMLEDAQ